MKRLRVFNLERIFIIIDNEHNYKNKDNYHGNCLTSLKTGSTGVISNLHYSVIVQYPISI